MEDADPGAHGNRSSGVGEGEPEGSAPEHHRASTYDVVVLLAARRTADGKPLSMGAIVVAGLVAGFKQAFFSVPYVASLLNRSESAVRGYVAELVDAGVVARLSRTNGWGGSSSNEYRFLLERAVFRGGPSSMSRPLNSQELPPEIKAAAEAAPAPRVSAAPARAAASGRECDQAKPEAQMPRLQTEELRYPEASRVHSGASTSTPTKQTPLALRGCRSPLANSPELAAALLSLPQGSSALRLLDRSGLTPESAKAAVERLLEYDRDKGVQCAPAFMRGLIDEQHDKAARSAERLEAERHEYTPPARQAPAPKARLRPPPAGFVPRELPEAVRGDYRNAPWAKFLPQTG